MKTLLINGSARHNSNTDKAVSDLYADEIHDTVSLVDMAVTPYSYDRTEWSEDDFEMIVKKMIEADT